MPEHNLARLAEQARERLDGPELLVLEGRTHRGGELFDRATRLKLHRKALRTRLLEAVKV